MPDGFNDVGFLGDDLDGWRLQVQAEFPESFAIAYRMNRMAMRMMWDLPSENLSEAQLLAIAGFYRALQSFQSALLLIERGALAEARALARLCSEAVFITAGLLKVGGTVEKLHEDNARHRLSMANAVIEMNTGLANGIDLTPFQNEVAAVNATYPARPNSIKWTSLATQSGMANLYELAYRLPSGDAAHVTLGALHRHILKGQDDVLEGLVFHPDNSDLRSTLLAANASLVHLLGLAHEFMGLGLYEPEIRDLLLQWVVSRAELGH